MEGLVGTTTIVLLHGIRTLWLSVFFAGRVILWAFLVIVGWLEIIEKDRKENRTQKVKYCGKTGAPQPLTAQGLETHNRTSHQPPSSGRWPKHIDRIEGVSDMGEGESLDEWPLWEENEDSLLPNVQHEGERDGNHMVGTPIALPVHRPMNPTSSRIIQKTRPEAGFGKAVGHHADDDTHILAQTTMGGNTDLIKEPARETVRKDLSSGQKVKEKKPFLTRKVEKWFIAPYTQKYERAGYMIYKGFNKVGHQIEISVDRLATDLDGAIRDAGVNAVREVESALQRWIKFFGLVLILSLILLPFPAFNVTFTFAH